MGLRNGSVVFDPLVGLQIAAGEEILHAAEAIWATTAGAFAGNPVLALGQLAPNVPPYSKLGLNGSRLPK